MRCEDHEVNFEASAKFWKNGYREQCSTSAGKAILGIILPLMRQKEMICGVYVRSQGNLTRRARRSRYGGGLYKTGIDFRH